VWMDVGTPERLRQIDLHLETTTPAGPHITHP
jgi:hypothetical protein